MLARGLVVLGVPRTASNPPCTRGCSVFTRPSIISGKPVNSETSATARPAAFSAAAVPPVETISMPRALKGGRERNETGLVGDRKESSTNALIGHVYPASSKQAVSRSARQNHPAAAPTRLCRAFSNGRQIGPRPKPQDPKIMPIRQAVRRAWSSAPPSRRTSFL